MGIVREPSGSTLTGIVPSNIYPTSDGKTIIIGANTNPMFQRLCELLGNAGMAQDPRYKENSNRVEHQTALDELIGQWTGSLTQADVLERLEHAGVAAGPIYSVADMLTDPQYQARNLFETVTIDGEPLKIPAIIPQLSATPGRTDWPGAALGAHNDEVFGQLLGMTDEMIAKLKQDGVV